MGQLLRLILSIIAYYFLYFLEHNWNIYIYIRGVEEAKASNYLLLRLYLGLEHMDRLGRDGGGGGGGGGGVKRRKACSFHKGPDPPGAESDFCFPEVKKRSSK